MIPRTLRLNNPEKRAGKTKTYYLYDTYSTKEEAIKTAKYHKRKNKCRYYIITHEAEGILGYTIPHKAYTLYLNKTIRLW